MSWVITAIAGTAAVSYITGEKAAESAATAAKDTAAEQRRTAEITTASQERIAEQTLASQERIAEESLAETTRQFDVVQETLQPYREFGESFLPAIRQFMEAEEDDYDEFLRSPEYQFTLEESEKALERRQATAGSRFGGGALKEAVQLASGLASTRVGQFRDYRTTMFNRLFNLAGIGSAAAAGTAQGAMQTGGTLASIRGGQLAGAGQVGGTLASGIGQVGLGSMSAAGQAGTNLANISMSRYANIGNTVSSAAGNLTTLALYNRMMSGLGGG